MLNGKLWHLEVRPRGQSTETEACELSMMMMLMTEVSKAFFVNEKFRIKSTVTVVNSDVKDLEENGADKPVSAEKRKLVVVLFRSHLRDNRDIFHLKMNFVSEWLDLIIFSATVALAVKTAQEI